MRRSTAGAFLKSLLQTVSLRRCRTQMYIVCGHRHHLHKISHDDSILARRAGAGLGESAEFRLQ